MKLSTLALAVAMAFGLAACGQDNQKSAGSTSGGSSGGPVT